MKQCTLFKYMFTSVSFARIYYITLVCLAVVPLNHYQWLGIHASEVVYCNHITRRRSKHNDNDDDDNDNDDDDDDDDNNNKNNKNKNKNNDKNNNNNDNNDKIN